MNGAIRRARRLFLDDRHPYGCAESTFLALKHAYRLPDPDDASAAMALNGGVAYQGDVCGAITGAALAIGLQADRTIPDHAEAKGAAREAVADLADAFRARFGAIECRRLLGRSIRTPEEHQAFLASDQWRRRCMAQIEFSVERLVGEAPVRRARRTRRAAPAARPAQPRAPR